jgi:hypothetical protein
VWKVDLKKGEVSKGSIYLTAAEGTFARYENPTAKKEGSGGFFQDVEKTFKGVGGDMEEFFTGDRTVDR